MHINNFAFGMQMHMEGCTCGDPLQLMKIIHHALNDIAKRMTCIMNNGRLRNLSSHHKIAQKVADDHRV